MAVVPRTLERPRSIFIDAPALSVISPDAARRHRRRFARRGPALASVAVLAGLWFGTGLLSGAPPAPAAAPIHLVSGLDYIVKPGDTLSSIAKELDRRGNPAAFAAKLRAELHGAPLRPGEVLRVS